MVLNYLKMYIFFILSVLQVIIYFLLLKFCFMKKNLCNQKFAVALSMAASFQTLIKTKASFKFFEAFKKLGLIQARLIVLNYFLDLKNLKKIFLITLKFSFFILFVINKAF